VIGLRRQFLAIAAQLFRRPQSGQSALGYMRASGQLLNAALLAQQEKRWPDAVRLWQEYVALVPSDIRGHINLGNSLLALDRVTEAATCAQAMRAKWPDRVEGAILFARTAALAKPPEERAALWQPVAATFPSSPTVQEELGRALLDAGRADEAATVEGRLRALDKRAATRLRGAIVSAAKNGAEAHAFWQAAAREFPEDADFRRKAIDAGLRIGSRDAVREFETLLTTNKARLSDVNFVIGIANLCRAGDDRAQALGIVRRYLKSLFGGKDYRLAALKLSRIVFGDFPHGDADAKTAPRRFKTMVRRTPMSDNAQAWWQNTCAVYDQMRAASPASLLDTDISREQCEAFVGMAREKLSAGRGFCFIRLGDAEANALHYEPSLAQFFAADTRARERSWWARELADEQRAQLNRDVNTAIWSADALGIPCTGRILRDMDLHSDHVLDTGRTGRGHRAVLNAVRERLESGQSAPLFASANLHQDLYRYGLYPTLLRGARDVVCVSSHANLPARLVSDFGVVSATNITLHSAHSARRMVDQHADAFALPDQRAAVMEAMDRQLDGRLVVVCAGYVGKWICHQAAQRGAVALDLGSIADYWMGARTRGYLELV
jgi:tetratricopeptide (TPR) repeat protein